MPETIDPPTEAPPDAPPPDWASVEGLPEYAALPPEQKATVVHHYADTLRSHVVGLGADPEQVGKEIDAFRQQKMSSIYPTQAQPALLDTSAPGSGSLATQERRKIVTGENAPPAANELTGLAASERAKIAGNTIIDNPQASTAGEGGAAPVRADGFDPSKQDAVSASVANVFHQGTTSLGDIVKGMAGLAVQYPGLPDTATAEDKMKWLNSSPDPLLQWARQTPQTAEDLFPVNPKYASNPVVQAIGSAGQLAPIVASGPFAPFVMAMQTAGQHIDNDYKSLLDSGLSPEQAAQKTFRNATAAGLTDEVVWSVLPAPLRAAGDKFLIDKFGADGVKKFLLGRVAQAGEGAVLGATSRISQNAAAGDHLLEGVGSSAAGLSLLQLLTPRGAPRGAHGETATHAPEDVRDHLANVSTQSLELASSDPEFRKTAPYDPALVDAELAKRHLSAAPDEAVQIAAGDTALREAAPDMHAAVLTELEKRNLSPADAEKVTAVREADRQAAAAKDAGLDETARALQEKADAARGEAVPEAKPTQPDYTKLSQDDVQNGRISRFKVVGSRGRGDFTDKSDFDLVTKLSPEEEKAWEQTPEGEYPVIPQEIKDAANAGHDVFIETNEGHAWKVEPHPVSDDPAHVVVERVSQVEKNLLSGAAKPKPISEVTPVKATERPAPAEAAQADLEKPVEQSRVAISDQATRRLNTLADNKTMPVSLLRDSKKGLSDAVQQNAQGAYDYAIEQSKRDFSDDPHYTRNFKKIADHIAKEWPNIREDGDSSGNSEQRKSENQSEKAGQQGLLSEAGAGSTPARQGTIKLGDRGASPTSDGTLFDEHLNETLARGWRKMGDFYESTAGNGGKHAPEEIAKALDLVANKDREGRTSIGIPYHMMARAIETLKSKGLWETDSSGSPAAGTEIKRSTTPSDSVRSQNPEAASPPVPPVSEGAAHLSKPTDLAHTVSTDLGKSLAVPKGATALRVTDAEGRVTVVKAADLKGANVLQGAGPYKKIEAGTVATPPGKRGEFVPLKEKVGVKDSPLIRLEQAADAARARLKEKLARTSSGVDPTIVSDLAIIAAHHIAKGGRDFADWTKQTVAEWGEAVRPHLQAAWDKATGSTVKGAENPSGSTVKDLGVSEEPQGSSETASHSAEVSHPSALKEGPLAHEQATAQAVADALREKGAAPVAADTIAKRYAAAAKVLNQRDADFGAREHVYDLLRDDLLANIEKTGSPFKTKTADGRVVDYSASMRASTKLADYLARGEQQNVRGEAAGTVAENAVAERSTNEARASQAASHVADAIDSGIADITSHPDFVADNPGVSRKDATQAARIVLDRITAQTFGESYGFSKGQPGRPSAAITKLVADPHFEKSVRENVLGRAFAAARDHEDDVFGFGPGAAAKGEIPEAKTVSIRSARVDEERAARGELPLMQPARKAMGTTWDQAMQRIERNPSLGSGMVDDILNRKKTDISEVDHAVLLHEKIEVMNNRSMEAERIADPHTSEEDRVEARVRWAALEDRINQIDQATHEAGTISGRALQFRRALAADDYTFSGMERKLRAVKGEALTPEESAGVKAQADRIADADKQATEREQAAGEKQAGAATDAAIKQMRGDKAPVDRNDVLAKMKARIADGDSPKDLGSYLQRIALSFVRAGITEREPLIQAVHDFTSDVTGFDPRQTRDAVSGYGDFKPLDKETAKVQLRQIKGEAQQISKLEDMSAGHAPKKTGIERREPSDEERVLIKEVNEAKKAGGFDVTDPEKQLKSALDAVKTRLGNQIKDLSRQIDTGERDVKTRRPVPTDAEADALRTQRDELKKQFDSIFGTERSEAQRLAAAKSYLTRRAADLEDRIARNDFAPRPKPAPVALDAEGLALRAKTEQLKLAFDRKLKQYELDNRKWWEKGLAQVAGTARAAALSGYDTLFKLLGYTIGKGIELPLNEAAKAGLEKIPGYSQIAAKANLEAGPHVKAVARYYREFATEGMKEAGRVLRTYGDSNLKSVYGKKNVSPPQWYDFFGVLHQAEKAPTLTAATALHLEKATAAAIASGADITDPMVQGALRKEAFDYAQRSILQEDNLAANLINGAMSRMRAKDPKTGEANAIRSAVASTVETLFTKGIIKTPANYVMQTLERTPVGLATGGVKAINAWRKGVDTLTNTEANTIHRLLSVGLVGSAMFVWGAIDATKDEKDRMFGGYYQPGEKRGDADTKWGTLRLQGHTISHLLTHFPVIESAQIGSTMMRVALSKLHKKDEQTRGIASGLISAVFGLIDRAPIASQAFRFTKVGDPMKQETAVGEILRGLIPQIVQNIAGDLDKRNGEPVHRAPTTIMQSLEMGIPGLRQRVPEKKAKSVKASDFWGS